MGATEGVKSRVSLFRATALQLNALQQNALYARQKNEGTGRAYRAIMVVRCFVNNVFSARYPSSNGLQTGYDHFVAIIHRRWTFMRAGARPLYDFFRVACTRASPCFTRFEKCFIAPIFLALSISIAINEKRSSCFFLLFYVTVFFFGFESFSLFSESFLDFTGLFIRLEEEKLVSLFGLFEFSIWKLKRIIWTVTFFSDCQ